MVRALLAGKKTQTRRLVKPQPNLLNGYFEPSGSAPDSWPEPNVMVAYTPSGKFGVCNPPYFKMKYQVGDLLWVREGWRTASRYDSLSPSQITDSYGPCQYKADMLSEGGGMTDWGRWRSSLHMPRWASRITLKVTGVKVERVQSISREDAAAEGICYLSEIGFDGQYDDRDGYKMNVIQKHRWPEENFGHLWMMINGYDSWNRNDWVFAYTFEVQP